MKYIKKYYNFINESNHFKGYLNLNDYYDTLEWVKSNAPDSLFDDDGELDLSYTDPMTGDDLDTLIYSYMNKYESVMNDDTIEIYRLLKLNDISDLDKNNIGVFWSFEEDGVGAYGIGGKFTGDNTFILTATINTNDIDWEQGFYSFLAYGKSEFECYVNKDSKITITKINDEELEAPIIGKA